MKTEQARIPITDFIKVWCELCRIRIDAREERTDVGGKTYHPDCYSTLFAAARKSLNSEIQLPFVTLLGGERKPVVSNNPDDRSRRRNASVLHARQSECGRVRTTL